MRGFSRGEEIRYNEIRLSFVLSSTTREKREMRCLFFAKKKHEREQFFFAHTHAKELSNSSHIKQQKTRVFFFSIHFCSSHKYVYFIHFRDGFIGKSFASSVARSVSGSWIFLFFRDFFSLSLVKEEGE